MRDPVGEVAKIRIGLSTWHARRLLRPKQEAPGVRWSPPAVKRVE